MKIKNHCKVDIKGLEMGKALDILKYIRNNDYIMDFLDKASIEEAIEELEEAMKPKTCDTCTYFDNELWGGDCLNFGFRCTSAGAEAHRPDDGFCCNRYKSKDS